MFPRTLAWCLTILALTAGASAQDRPTSGPGSGSAVRVTGARTLRIYIARHGETASNAERRVLGQIDQPLNARGIEQARVLRDLMRGVRLDGIYTSPLARGVTTAGIVADGRPVRALANLKERNQGRFQGLLADSEPDFARRMASPGDDLDGGETTFQLRVRASRALASIRQMQPTGSVLIVGHFLTNQMLLRELLGLTVERAMRINQANDELYVVELAPGLPPRTWKLIQGSNLGDL